MKELATKANPDDRALSIDDVAVGWLSSVTSPGSNTAKIYLAELNTMRQRYGDAVCSGDLSQADVRRIYTELCEEYGYNRANHYMSVMSSFGKWTVLSGLARSNPFASGNVKRHKPDDHIEERIMERDEVRAIVENGRTEQDRLMLRFLYVTWLRVDEAAGARWGRTSSRGGHKYLTVRGKGGKTRTILLPTALYNELLKLMPPPDSAGQDAVILRQRNRKPYSIRQIQRVMEASLKRSGLPFWDGKRWLRRPSPHWLRHAGAAHFLEAGGAISVCQARLGHASLATTSIYTRATAQAIESAHIPDPWA